MKLDVGKATNVRFMRFMAERNMFACCANALVLEWDPKTDVVTLYATNSDYNAVYAVGDIYKRAELKKQKILVVGSSEDVMLLDAGELRVLVDFAGRRVSVNRPGIVVTGKGEWGSDVQCPWGPEFDEAFAPGVTTEEEPAAPKVREVKQEQPDEDAALRFWSWFAQKEEELVEKILTGGEHRELAMAKIRARLAAVFPYEKPEAIEFQIGGDGEKNELVVFHLNALPMKDDAEKLGGEMPETLKERWRYRTEA